MSIASVFTAVVGALSSPVANATGNILTAANTGMNIAELNKLKKIQTGINCANARLTCIDRGQNDLISQIDEFVDAIDDVVDFPQANVQPGQPQPVTPAPAPTAEATTAPVSAPAPADEMAKMWAAINRLAAGGAVTPTPAAAPATPVAEAPVAPTPAAAPATTPTAAPAPAAVVNVGTAAPTSAPVAAPTEEYATKEDLATLIAQIQSMAGSVNTLTDSLEKLTAATAALDAAAGESAPPAGGKPKK